MSFLIPLVVDTCCVTASSVQLWYSTGGVMTTKVTEDNKHEENTRCLETNTHDVISQFNKVTVLLSQRTYKWDMTITGYTKYAKQLQRNKNNCKETQNNHKQTQRQCCSGQTFRVFTLSLKCAVQTKLLCLKVTTSKC